MEVFMGTATKQANFLLPEDLIEKLRQVVPKREQSKVVAEALRKELKRLKLRKAIDTSFGAWENKKHPELRDGTEGYIRQIRKSTRLNPSR